jgi:hypothetical protein
LNINPMVEICLGTIVGPKDLDSHPLQSQNGEESRDESESKRNVRVIESP